MKIATIAAFILSVVSMSMSAFLMYIPDKHPQQSAKDQFQLFPASNGLAAYKFNKQTGAVSLIIKEKEQKVFNPWEVTKALDPKDPLDMLDMFNKIERNEGPVGSKGNLQNIAVFRTKYPQYIDVSDIEIASALHKKYYSYMKFEDFCFSIGVNAKAQVPFDDLIPGKDSRPTADEFFGPEKRGTEKTVGTKKPGQQP